MRQYALSLLVLMMIAPTLSAQEDVLRPGRSRFPFALGIEIGPNFSIFSQDVGHSPINNPTSPERVLESGSGLGGFASLLLDVPISRRIGIQGKAGIELKRFTTSGEGVADCPNNGDGVFDTVSLDVERVHSTMYFTAGIFLRADITDNLLITVGPVVHRWLGSMDMSDRAEITTPGNCLFTATGTKTAEIETTIETGLQETRIGIEAGVGYRIPLTRKLNLIPALRFQYMIDPISEDGVGGVDTFRERTLGALNLSFTDRTLHAVHLGIGLMWQP
jgi:hypothetical protein